MDICSINKCTGCFACKSICPKDAISIEIDQTGKEIPNINKDKCIDCGLCKEVCPELNSVNRNCAKYSIAAVQKERGDRLSSSGGVATALAEKIIDKGGVVIGCASLEGKVQHVIAQNSSELKALKGSKYVYSRNGKTYKEIKEILESKKIVLYVGTPCQVAGLKNFLRKDYVNLFTVDLICHGVPPFKYLSEHIESKVKNKKWDRVTFRGIRDFYLSVYDNDKIVYSRKSKEDLYFSAFLDGLTYRENCYTCQYANPERVGDITLGDFWGLNRNSLQVKMQGRISVCLPNSEKGEKLLLECEDILFMEKRPFNEAVNEKQGNLIRPSKRHEDRDEFLTLYRQYGFDKAVSKTSLGKQVKKTRIKNILMKPFRKVIRSIKKLIKK